MKNIDLSDLISQAEAARIRGVTREAIYNLVARGRLNTKEVLGRKYVYRSEVLAFEPAKTGVKPVSKKKGGKK